MNYFECCHKCVPPKRYPGCSGTCPEYAEARAKFDADKARNDEARVLRNYKLEKNAATKDGIAKYTKRRPHQIHI
jgi:hypothetical protein